MTKTGIGVALCALVCAAGLACRTQPKPTDLPESLVRQRWVEPHLPPDAYIELDRAMVEGLAVAIAKQAPPDPAVQARPQKFLALSAGGKFGAYTAGVLAGWQANGTRPNFDVVTGVSSGAIIALYTFLGPQYDDRVRHFFTEYGTRDLFKFRPLRYFIRDGAIASAAPLERVIAEAVNDCVVQEICAAHLSGRRLYLATLNIQAKRACIWDIGAIACSGRPDAGELIRKIMLAACAVPGMVKPVEFDVVVDGRRYVEKHSDGGAVTQTFLEIACHQAKAQPGTRWLDGSKLFIVAAGKYVPDPAAAQMGILGRIGASVSASLYALYRAELCKLYALCLTTGLDYNIVALDPGVMTDTKSLNLDPAQMKILYNAGFQQACGGVPWRKMPPGGLIGEDETPRTGTCFVTVPETTPPDGTIPPPR